MEATAVTALAAALGSVIGASASIVTTWIAQRTQTIREHLEWKLRERESLYKEFITEASLLAVDSLTHSLERPDQLGALYGILSCIRLVAGDEVLGKAEDCCHRILERYRQPNMTAVQIHVAYESNEIDPLKDFSAACRAELLALSSKA
jgi:hypothetical protein